MQLVNRNYPAASVPNVVAGSDAAREQVERVLASNTFHASEVLRRLLKFLADKTFLGEADELKEYSVGLDALGKPATYDPRQDAAVRLHASRLRQKLDDYYRREGMNDALIVELPKGRFKIAWHAKEPDPPPSAVAVQPAAVPQALQSMDAGSLAPHHKLRTWRNLAMGSMAAALLLAFIAVWSLTRTRRTPSVTSPELEAVWSPFLSTTRPLIIAFVNPLFVRLQRKDGGDVVYRTSGNFTWNDVTGSPEFPLLKRILGDAVATPTFNLVERSNLISTFVLAQFFARRRSDISLARADELSWQQFADNDVIVFGPFAIDDGESALPVKPLLAVEKAGIRNFRPEAGEPAFYPDPANHSPIDGEALELVSVLPGPLGRTTVVTFSGNNKWGVIGGVQSLTDPTFARVVVRRLKGRTGKIPPYYQIVLRFTYRDGTLTHVSYVTHRELALAEGSTSISEK